jgi:Protein of unknown function (DUF4012)
MTRHWSRLEQALRGVLATRMDALSRWRPPHVRRIGLWLAVVLGAGLLTSTPVVLYAVGHGIESGVTLELRQGQGDLEAGRSQLEAAYRAQDARAAGLASARFRSSQQHFKAAAKRASVLGGASLPGLRSRLDSLQAVVDMGVHLGDGGVTAAQLLVDSGLAGERRRASSEQLLAPLDDLAQDLHAAAAAAARIQLADVPDAQRPVLARARTEIESVVTLVDQVRPSIPAVLDLLGFNGPRSYLIEQVNPSELRSGGGFIGTVSVVHTDGGRVGLQTSLPVEQFDYCDAVGCVRPRPRPWQPGYVAPPAELTGYPLPAYSQLTAWSLEDSGFYPDFASNATVAASFCERLLGFRPDGVVAVDYYAVAPLLDLTGPLALPKYRVTLTAKNFVDVIVGLDLARSPIHKEVIAAAADLLLGKLARLPPSAWRRALEVVGAQFARRHLQVHLDVPVAAEAARRLGLSDAFRPSGPEDFLLETEDNYGGSKANYFLDRRYQLTLSRTSETLHHRLAIDLTDRAPADQRPIGPHYFAYVRLYVPDAADRVTMLSAPSRDYLPILRPGRRSQRPPPGAQVTGGWMFVDVGNGLSGHYEVTFEWDTAWSAEAGGQQVLYWAKQPGTVADPIFVTWQTGSHTFTARGDLSTDRLLHLSDGGVTLT